MNEQGFTGNKEIIVMMAGVGNKYFVLLFSCT